MAVGMTSQYMYSNEKISLEKVTCQILNLLSVSLTGNCPANVPVESTRNHNKLELLLYAFLQMSPVLILMFLFCYFQSVDNEIVLWEPKLKDQSPGEVRIPYHSCTFELSFLNIYSLHWFISCIFLLTLLEYVKSQFSFLLQ